MLKIVKNLLPWILIGLIGHSTMLSIKAVDTIMVTKYDLPYEVMSITVNNGSLTLQGWAFISYKQHFDSSSDHSIQLEFVSAHDRFTVDANLTSLSQTTMMTYFGSPSCSETSTFQVAEVCNYRYESVGFTVSIPLSTFNATETYQTNIIVNAYRANLSYKTPLYYPLTQDLSFENSGKQVSLISRLDDTNLQVNATTVLARKEPSKTGLTWFYGANCSTGYLNQLFFLLNTTYVNVYEKRLVNDTSFYRVSANLYICSVYRRRIIEGSSITPVWIASPYVSYTGSPLQIFVKNLNLAPSFQIENIELTEGDAFNYHSNVHAYDPEEGDISDRIELVSSNYMDKPGLYQLDFKVTDSYGLSALGQLIVNVLTKPNFVPILTSYDQTILQNSTFDPMDKVSGTDIEDGDLTSLITYTSNVDTGIIGNYDVCYAVVDTQGAKTSQCNVINVISLETWLGRYRFVSYNLPFFNESIPNLWNAYLNTLNDLLKPMDPIMTMDLD